MRKEDRNAYCEVDGEEGAREVVGLGKETGILAIQYNGSKAPG